MQMEKIPFLVDYLLQVDNGHIWKRYFFTTEVLLQYGADYI